MIKKIVVLLIMLVVSVAAQIRPTSYKVGESKMLAKAEDNTPTGNSVTNILVTEKAVWLATSRGLSKSVDGGESWTNYYNEEPFGDESIISLGYHDGIIWIATGYRNQSDVDVGTGLKYSMDEGETWNEIPQPVDTQNDSIVMYGENRIRALPVTVREQNIIWDMAFTGNTIWIASWAGGLRKSNIDELIQNPDKKWDRVVIPPDNLDEINPEDQLDFNLQVKRGTFGDEEHLNHVAFSLVAPNDSTLYLGTAGGINKSTDGGISWKKFSHTNQTNSISGNFVVALGYNHYDNSIWGATWKAEDLNEYYAVSASWDGGENWSTFLSGERPHNFGFKFEQPIVPTDNGIYRSDNNGKDWISATDIKDSTNLLGDSNIIESKNSGRIFTTVFFDAKTSYLNDLTVDIWVGSANGLGIINEKENSKIWSGDWKVLKATQELKSQSETYCAPNPYYPSNNSPLRIVYGTNNKSADVTIRVLDFDMNLVKTIIQNAPRSGSQLEEYWNGRDENNQIVPNGVYFYTVEIGDDEPLYNKIMILR